MTTPTSCVFCGIQAGQLPARLVYEDADHIAFLPLEHINPGHVVLIPRHHTDYLFDLDASAYARLWAVAATLAGPFIRSVRAGEPGANSKIRVGLIGCGGMGGGDLECFFRNPEVDCAVVADVDDAQLAKGVALCAKHGRPRPDTARDFRRVLDRKDVDAVIIATPDHWHALPTVLACQAGKDVYVEKPLATTIDEGRAMLTAARKHNRVVQMGTQRRSWPVAA